MSFRKGFLYVIILMSKHLSKFLKKCIRLAKKNNFFKQQKLCSDLTKIPCDRNDIKNVTRLELLMTISCGITK